jgi:hypothetical protein
MEHFTSYDGTAGANLAILDAADAGDISLETRLKYTALGSLGAPVLIFAP